MTSRLGMLLTTLVLLVLSAAYAVLAAVVTLVLSGLVGVGLALWAVLRAGVGLGHRVRRGRGEADACGRARRGPSGGSRVRPEASRGRSGRAPDR